MPAWCRGEAAAERAREALRMLDAIGAAEDDDEEKDEDEDEAAKACGDVDGT